MSRLGAWALALGASVGWGSLVVTSNTYLVKAGPAGSVLGLVIATAIMLVIAYNYHYLMNRYPEAGGAYIWSKETFGYDNGFLTAWFLFLVYIAVFWANATSLPLFARYFIGDLFKFGFHYTVFGYELYFGEILLTFAAMMLVSLLCISKNRAVQLTVIIMVIIFCLGVAFCTLTSFAGYDKASFSFEPFFIPEKKRWFQAVQIACISPWAFIGFENISHSSEELSFPRKKSFNILAASAISAALVYIFIILLSVTAYPSEYANWREYISDIGNLNGIRALPAFYATYHYFGQTGLAVLMTSLLCLVFTTMISNVVALSRLIYSVSKDSVIPKRIFYINGRSIPQKAVMLIPLVSIPVLFLGRTAIGWIVDVTTIGATLIYGFVSASTFKAAGFEGNRKGRVTGFVGMMFMIVFGIFLLLPNLLSQGDMANESYILFAIWSVLGFWFFRGILKKDSEGLYGRSIIVWISLLSLLLITSLIWMNQASLDSASEAIENVREYYDSSSNGNFVGEDEFINEVLYDLHVVDIKYMSVVAGLFILALGMLLTNYRIMTKRAIEKDEELGKVRRTAYIDPLTGVKSKHAFSEKESAIDEMIKNGVMEDFAVVVCDVNGLKHINDTYGHKAGDEYICKACSLLCDVFVHSPVYRTGGDEFVIVTTGSDFNDRVPLMDRLNRIVEENITLEKVVVSAGISDYEKDSDNDMHEVFVRADALMYERKKELKAMGARVRE